MAERAAPKRRASRQAMAELVADAEKAVAQRKEAEAKPEERIAAKAVSEAVAVADAISSEGVVRLIGELKSTMTRTLTQLSDRLEEEIGKYSRICRAIAAKDERVEGDLRDPAIGIDAAGLPGDARSQAGGNGARLPGGEGAVAARDRNHAGRVGEGETNSTSRRSKERDAAEQKRRQREAGGIQVQFRPRTAAGSGPIGRRDSPRPKRNGPSEKRNWSASGPSGKRRWPRASRNWRSFAPCRRLCRRVEGGHRACGGRGRRSGPNSSTRRRRGTAPPRIGRGEERSGHEDRRLGADGPRAGRAAFPARTAGREGVCAGPGNRRRGRSKDRPARSNWPTFSNSLPNRSAREVHPNDDATAIP